jgi:hypothetical protein
MPRGSTILRNGVVGQLSTQISISTCPVTISIAPKTGVRWPPRQRDGKKATLRRSTSGSSELFNEAADRGLLRRLVCYMKMWLR